MGEKVYRPILKDGDHLVRSKENQGRVRGVSQDANNKTTDIVEWEEIELEKTKYDYSYNDYNQEELTPEQKERAEIIGQIIASMVIYGATQLHEHVIGPWWKNTAKPWIKNKFNNTKQLMSGKTKVDQIMEGQNNSNPSTTEILISTSEVQLDEMFDKSFDRIQFDVTTEEAKVHMMNLVYHMLGVAYEIRVLSSARIVEQVEDENVRIEKQKQAEYFLAEKVASKIDALLSNEALLLDVVTSKELYNLFNGGIRFNGEYVPVEVEKVITAIDSVQRKPGEINNRK